jgi:hypothetical protein
MKKQYPLRMDKNIFNEIQRQAEEDGISLNSWMNMKFKKIAREIKNKK